MCGVSSAVPDTAFQMITARVFDVQADYRVPAVSLLMRIIVGSNAARFAGTVASVAPDFKCIRSKAISPIPDRSSSHTRFRMNSGRTTAAFTGCRGLQRDRSSYRNAIADWTRCRTARLEQTAITGSRLPPPCELQVDTSTPGHPHTGFQMKSVPLEGEGLLGRLSV
jgi:hypothetical protein